MKAKQAMAAFRSDRTDGGREYAAATERTNGPGENKTAGTEDGGVRYSIESLDDGTKYVVLDGDLFLNSNGTEMTPSQAYKALVGQRIVLENGDTITFIKNLPNVNLYHIGIVDFDTRSVVAYDGNEAFRIELNIANLTDGSKIAYVKRYVEKADTETLEKIKRAETGWKTPLNQLSNVI